MTPWLLTALLLLPQTGRDTSASAGTSVSGIVVGDDGNGRPVRHAQVTLTQVGGSATVAMITNDDGAFAFNDLKPGTYQLVAGKPGFLTTAYGMRAGRDIGTPIVVDTGRPLVGLRVPLRRGGVVSGIVTGPSGEPVVAATVSAAWVPAIAMAPLGGNGLSLTIAQAITDDTGAYRIYGLGDGDYAILASVAVDPTSAPYAPTPKPAAGFSEGPIVSVRSGEERAGVDVRMRISPPARVQGTLIDQEGRPVGGRFVSLDSGSRSMVFINSEHRMNAMTGEDGSFSFTNVPAGTYEVHYEEGMDTDKGPPYLPAFWARSAVVVDGKDVLGVSLALQRATPISGRLILDRAGDTAPPPFSVSLWNLEGRDLLFTKASDDGTFSFPGAMPGRHRVEVASADNSKRSQWRLSAATVKGRSVLDGDFVVTADPVTDIILTVSDDVGAVRGSIVNANGTPATDYLVVVFPDLAAEAMTILNFRIVAPDTNGNWLVDGRVPGAYRVAAVSEWTTQTTLTQPLIEQLRAASTPLTITRGVTTTVPLRIDRD